jgi:membrane protein required for colicin V production
MNWADWIIVSIVGVSCLISFVRGFVKEAISLAIWVSAFIISMLFHESLAYLLTDYISTASVRRMIAIGTLFSATLIVGAMLNYLIGELVRMTGLSGTDRLFGMVFGFVRGVILVLVLVMFLPPILAVDQDSWWQQSKLIPHLLMLEDWSRQTGQAVLNFFLNHLK